MAKVLAKQGGGDVEPLALGVDRAVVDYAGYHVGGEAVRGFRQLDGGDVDAARDFGVRAALGGRGVGALGNVRRGPHLHGQGNDHTGCKRGGEVVYAAPAAFLFVVCGLIDELVVDVAEAAGKAVVFHRVMSSEMSASLSKARSRMRSEAVLDFVQPMRAARAVVRVVLADDLLADLKIAGLLLDVDAGDRGQRKVHVARRAGRAALGVEEGERVLLVFRAVCADIIPQVHVFTDGRVDAADVADERVVQKDPHVVVAEERIVQRPDIIRRQRKRHRILHAEEGVVGSAVVTARESAGFGCPVSVSTADIAAIRNRFTGFTENWVFFVLRTIQRPEIVGEDDVFLAF